ncbi:MAG TPA: DUF4157 domain-containing protein [Steroidobacteraceae bacterium]|nr:DUF4157 domain-containing protein [Steroidobacteraceae bacterium]
MRGLAAMPSTLQTGPARFIFDQHRFIRDSLSNAKDAAMFASRISKRQLTPARSGAKTPRHERATDETARFIGASTDVPAATSNFCRISIHSARPGRPLAQLSWAGSPPPVAGQSLPMGRLQDASEQEADRVASRAMSMTLPRLAAGRVTEQATEAPILRAKGGSGGGPHGGDAPGIVHQVLRSEGQALDSGTRSFFEPRFGLDFSHVRVHTDPMAAQSARAVGARAYAVNNRIVFAAGQYQPSSALGRGLLAHELAHTAMSAGKSVLCRQPDSTAAPVRQDFVFLMGADAKKDPNKFYTVAERFYRAHLPKAVFVKSQRSLDGLLKFLAAHVATPAANIYIVAHGNEDGTLAFALDGAEKDHHLTVNQLRAALHPKTGASSLSSVSSAVDANTRIHIKGCDIGRTREMVELLDEAFGGAGTVTAPTHEQDFYTDPYLGAKARQQEHDTRIAAFKEQLPAVPDVPQAVDKKLTGKDKKEARSHRAQLVKERQGVISRRAHDVAAEEKRIVPELDAVAAAAGTEEALSGPMFQRPGTTPFTAEELQPKVDRLYGHLDKTRRVAMVRALVAKDKRAPAIAQKQGTYKQIGQRLERHVTFTQRFAEPANLSEARIRFRSDIHKNHFTPKSMTVTRTGDTTEYELTGRSAPPKQAAFDFTMTFTATEPDHQDLIRQGRALVQNPDRYEWKVKRSHSANGSTTLSVVGERTIAYLHHGTLNVGKHDYFLKDESDTDFYATAGPPPPVPPPREPRRGPNP